MLIWAHVCVDVDLMDWSPIGCFADWCFVGTFFCFGECWAGMSGMRPPQHVPSLISILSLSISLFKLSFSIIHHICYFLSFLLLSFCHLSLFCVIVGVLVASDWLMLVAWCLFNRTDLTETVDTLHRRRRTEHLNVNIIGKLVMVNVKCKLWIGQNKWTSPATSVGIHLYRVPTVPQFRPGSVVLPKDFTFTFNQSEVAEIWTVCCTVM